jgi:indole-3-glycerol phosphate synthase
MSWRTEPEPKLPEGKPNRKMPVLDAIVDATRASLPALQGRRAELERAASRRAPPPDFETALAGPFVALVAEVKRRSPSAGAINQALDPVHLATAYRTGGATAISVLTNSRFFGGSIADLDAVAAAVELPVLRKDFILDETQLLETRAAGASAVLLIVRILPQAVLERLLHVAASLGLAVLVETHNPAEVVRATDAGATIIGVNARDLDSLVIDTAAALALLATVPADCLAVAESGMASREDVGRAAAAGADAVLIGSALAAAGDPAGRTRELTGVNRRAR